jgi:chromosome segregation ATPase
MSAERDTAGIREEIRALEVYCEELAEAIGEFEHEARRCRDRQERAGGESRQAAKQLKRVEDNRKLNRKELERARRRLDELRGRLPED